jgi:hypothetical protein
MMTHLRSLAMLAAVTMAAFTGCDKEATPASTHGAPPPPETPTAKPGACATGGGVVNDPVSAAFFPRVVDAYCVDPQGEVRTYGEQGKLDMDAVCTTAFDGECAIYTQLGLKRLVSMRYVDGAGAGATVDVYLSRFKDVTGAYAMFTKRVVADSDPAEPTTPRAFEAGGAAAIGTGRAYVWKDTYLAELQYNNEQETPEALVRSSAKALSSLGKAIGAALPGSSTPPAGVPQLPAEHRVPGGIQVVVKDALGVTGLGPLAVGYYAEGAIRYRVVVLAGADDARSKEAWKLLRRPGALPVAGVGDEGLVVTFAPATPAAAPRRDYVFARRGAYVVGVGDEELGAAGADASGASRLTKDQKIAHLKAALAALPAK